MPTTLLRGITGASRRTSASGTSVSVSCTPTYNGSPASPTSRVSGAGIASSSTSPVTTPNCGSSPEVNLAMRTPRAYRRVAMGRLLPLGGVETLTTAVLEAADWTARRDAHEARVDAWVQPHLARRRAGVPHPVEGFLFTYYAHRPAALRRWHPGFGVALAAAPAYADLKGYEVRDGTATVSPGHVTSQLPLLRALHRLLTATAARPAQLGCFGLHEWAMVYRLEQHGVRHAGWPLRLGGDGTDAVVESHRVACSHFDA